MLELPPVKQSDIDIKIGTQVRILDRESAFHMRQGTVTAYSNGYLVKLLGNSMSVLCKRCQLIPYNIVEDIEVPAKVQLDNLYRRYMWVKFEAYSEVLELLKLTGTIDEVRETLCGYMHKHYTSCLKHPVDVVHMLPRQDSIVLNGLVKEHRSVKRNGATKRGL